ncbi:MAG: TRAP transporter small permease [Rubrivivax sp.]|nr:TRAP transporter small permease [Rubrivivax sp.]
MPPIRATVKGRAWGAFHTTPVSPPAATPSAATRSARVSGRAAALEAALVRANQWLVVALMASMAALVFLNVVTRYLFNHSIIWVEELTQYQMIWVAYLGAGLALRESRHVAVDSLQDLLPAPWRRHLRTLLAVAMAVFLAVLAVLGFQIVAFTWGQETPVMNIPTGVPYLAVPVGAAAFLLHLVLFWRRFVQREFEAIEDPAGRAEQEADALPGAAA